jgi:hypothetical protein
MQTISALSTKKPWQKENTNYMFSEYFGFFNQRKERKIPQLNPGKTKNKYTNMQFYKTIDSLSKACIREFPSHETTTADNKLIVTTLSWKKWRRKQYSLCSLKILVFHQANTRISIAEFRATNRSWSIFEKNNQTSL